MLRCKNSLQIRNIVFLSQYTHLSLDIEGARNPWGGSTFYPSKSWSRSFEQFCSGWSGEQIKRPKSNLIQTGAHISMPNHGFGRWLASHTGQWFELRVPNGQLCKVMRQKKTKQTWIGKRLHVHPSTLPRLPKDKDFALPPCPQAQELLLWAVTRCLPLILFCCVACWSRQQTRDMKQALESCFASGVTLS